VIFVVALDVGDDGCVVDLVGWVKVFNSHSGELVVKSLRWLIEAMM
jgi:hypothetical protein